MQNSKKCMLTLSPSIPINIKCGMFYICLLVTDTRLDNETVENEVSLACHLHKTRLRVDLLHTNGHVSHVCDINDQTHSGVRPTHSDHPQL